MFRFSTAAEAADALAAINANYERHCRAAREIAEAHFDARRSLETILNVALSARKPSSSVLPIVWPPLTPAPASHIEKPNGL